MADAPVQGCRWDKMITQDFLNKINLLSKEYGVEVIIRDFRRTISDSTNNSVEKNLHPMSEYIIFDVSERSFLEPITTEENRFRVTCYNPDRMAEVHHKGVHKYCIAKKFFEADVVITIPKLKTHRMAGMTNALKLLVGINGDKDYLPHHRIGSVREGGDNYKNWNLLRTLSNRFLDEGNRHRGTSKGKLLSKVGSILFRLSKPDKATLTNAGWYGNDTIWRTVMDINTIAIYGDKEGHLHDTPQRQLYTIMDGIIGGQGDGPLHPAPAPLGVLAFSDNPYLLDVAAGYLYHLEHERIPLLKAAKKLIEGEYCHVAVNNAPVSIEDLYEYGIDIQLSPGWQEYKK
jgi:uncharacterized protein (DUF362 family)